MLSSCISNSTCTILLIDDDRGHLQFWSAALRDCSPHYLVLEASCREEASRHTQLENVDCVVLDLDLPDSSGFSILFDLIPDRAQPQIAVVILTQLLSPNLQHMALHNGAQACLIKQQTSPRELNDAIRHAILAVAALQQP